ncbi:MAG: cyclodeaminase/cyclohydrolase family protein [Proteobacteria bacterium]|nr:cyclodeaminase/cyclohydrolase family protein [Pseudomonadota bacterium]
MTSPISDSTLERFRAAAASGDPAPAGVAVAAVSAGFALGLAAKALAVSARRGPQSAELAKLEPLTATLRSQSSRMLELAAGDAAAFEAYLACVRLPYAKDEERIERRHALDAALRQAIDLPLAAARAAAAGLQLCAEALPMTDLVVLADLAAAVTLLCGSLRAFLLCAESNVRVLGPRDSSHAARLAEETGRQRRALDLAEEVLERVAGTLRAASPRRDA